MMVRSPIVAECFTTIPSNGGFPCFMGYRRRHGMHAAVHHRDLHPRSVRSVGLRVIADAHRRHDLISCIGRRGVIAVYRPRSMAGIVIRLTPVP